MARAFDSTHYVEDAGNGHYRVIWNGNVVYDGDKDGAQNAFNQWDASESGGGSSGPTYTSPTAPTAPTPSGAGGSYQTRSGLLTADQLRQALSGANYPGPWDPDSMVAAYNRADPAYRGGGGTTPSDPNSLLAQYTNLGASDLAMRAAIAQGQLGLARDQFSQLQLPSLALQQQVANWQNDYQNRALAQQNQQFQGTLGLQQGQLGLQESLGRGDLGLRGLGQAAQEAIQRAQLGMQAATTADQQAMARAALLAQLRGPADAFQQQKVLYGMNREGGSQLADILAGRAPAPLYQAPQAQPIAASIDTLANQMAGLPVDTPRTQAVATPTGMLMGMAQQFGGTPYQSPTINAAMAMAQPNAQYAAPYSTMSQIPTAAGQIQTGLQQLRDSNYGLTGAGADAINSAVGALRNNPQYAAADGETKRQMEAQAVAGATGLPMAMGRAVIDQLRGYTAQTGQMASPDVINQALNGQVGEYRRQQEANILGQSAGLDPMAARQLVDQMRAQTAATGQMTAQPNLQTLLAQRLGSTAPLYQSPMTGADTRIGPLEGGGMQRPFNYVDEPFNHIGPLADEMPQRIGPLEGGGIHLYQPSQAQPNAQYATLANQMGWTGDRPIYQAAAMKRQFDSEVAALSPDQRAAYVNSPAFQARVQQMTQLANTATSNATGGGGMRYATTSPMGAQSYASPRNPNEMPSDAPRTPTDPMMGTGGQPGGGQTGQQQANQFLSAMPAPNQIVARNFLRLPQSSQQFTLGAYEAKGYDPNDVMTTIRNTLPQLSQGSRNYGMVAG